MNRRLLTFAVVVVLALASAWFNRSGDEGSRVDPARGASADLGSSTARSGGRPTVATPNIARATGADEQTGRIAARAPHKDAVAGSAQGTYRRPTATKPAAVAVGLKTSVQARVKSYGKVVYDGPVDLSRSIARIRAGERHPHRNDGSVFKNREKRLPKKPRGYYREYVHPTRGQSGPGPQRLIVGNGGEWYYSPDHYASFIALHDVQGGRR